jgi:hypothetical protein
MSSNRSLLVIGGGIVALVVLAVAVVLLAEARGPSSFEPGSPQDAMQRYLAAWDERDYEAAYGFFSAEVRAEATLEQYESQARAYGGDFLGTGETATYIDRVEGDGDRVAIHLTVEQYYNDGGPGGGSYRSQRTVHMVRESAGWKIDEPLIGIEAIPFSEFPL